MEATPRLRSAFPQTPPANASLRSRKNASSARESFGSPKLPDVKTLQPAKPAQDAPWIAFEVIDAPTQRLYAFAVWMCLLAYRLYDWYALNVDDAESLLLFLKWTFLDGVFLFGLPTFHIPWLEWSFPTIVTWFCIHTFCNAMLMFRIGLPFGSLVTAMFSWWSSGTEYAISETSVKISNILNDHKLILGRQIINILPEGSALINPYKIPLCIADGSSTVRLPIQINQTVPVSIELLRHDLETDNIDIVNIGSREVNKLRKEALKHHNRDASQPLLLHYNLKKTGVYKLGKVLDETKLEVSHPPSEAFVVQCPSTTIGHGPKVRCKGELSNLAMDVSGTPPLTVSYRKVVNRQDRDVTLRGIQPTDFVSPLVRHKTSEALVLASQEDFSWAQPRTMRVSLNESLADSGNWMFSIDNVTDVFGNFISYSSASDLYEKSRQSTDAIEDTFYVFDRPRAALSDRIRTPLKVARGEHPELPIRIFPGSKRDAPDQAYDVTYMFTPDGEILDNGEHSPNAQTLVATVDASSPKPRLKAPGLYSLTSVSANSCRGEVIEPSTLQIINPSEPSVEITSEKIFDKCAGRPIGLRVDFDFSGTPPFEVWYEVSKDGRRGTKREKKSFDSLRGQMVLRPEDAGLWQYQLTELSDDVYRGLNIRTKDLKLEQNVKPSVSARFANPSSIKGACLDDPVAFDVQLFGEGPWTLEYELVHGNKRRRSKVENIAQPTYTIQTDALTDGGEYSLILVGVSDQQKCREALQQGAKVTVRSQRPKAAFGPIDGRRSIKTLQSKSIDLPIRLTGEAPWTVEYEFSNPDRTVKETKQVVLRHANDALPVQQRGRYELLSVRDAKCPGAADNLTSANVFEVDWIPRPSIEIHEGPLQESKGENRIVRNEVCEADDDAVDILLRGQPPYDVSYVLTIQPETGSRIVRPREDITVPVNTAQIKLDTSRAGKYSYAFTELGDYNYDHDAKRHREYVIEQRVNARPTATFASPGKVYSFCTSDDVGPEYGLALASSDATETIPITLTGKPPFVVDLEIKHHGRTSRPTPLSIPNIASLSHNLAIPRRFLQTGNSYVSIRRVRDAQGCERLLDTANSPRVQLSVHDSPSIVSTEPERTHHCVGDRVSFALSGMAPFSVFYEFEGKERKANSPQPVFKRLAESPGNFTVTGIQDSASVCRAPVSISKIIHAMPRVEVSHGKESRVDIHAGGEADISFDFYGVPPFEFTYARLENTDDHGRQPRHALHPGTVLETHTLESRERTLKVKASEAGTYEVVALRDRYCSYARPGFEGEVGKFRSAGLLT